MPAPDTFPRLLIEHAQLRGDRPAIREKDLGIWQTHSWKQSLAEVRSLACGLHTLGLGRGDALAIIGDNRPRLYWAMDAAQALGAIPVPLYQDAVAEEMAFVLSNAEVRIAIVEDQEQADKLLEVKARCPSLELIVYDDPRGLRHYDRSILRSYDDLQAAGRDLERTTPDFFDRAVAQGRSSDVAIMLYTSGTTGTPKGVMLTHQNLIETGRGGIQRERLTADEEVLAYLPMAWVGDNVFNYSQGHVAGFCVSCPESPDTVLTDMREIGPTYFFAPPRVLENLLTTVSIRMEDSSRLKRWLYARCMAVARRWGPAILDGKPVPFWGRLLYALADLLMLGPLRNVLGFSRVRVAYTAGEAIGPDLFRFYRSLGVNLKQLYGSTETSVFVCIQPNGQAKLESVGTPATGVELRISEQGEVQVKSPGVFLGYFKAEAATREAMTADGFFRTGDAGFFDEDGHLRIIDRAKDVGRLRDGTLFAPKYLENKLKFFPFIKEAVAFGDRHDFAAAFVCIDLAAVGNWAERRNLPYTGYTDLAGQTPVHDLIRGCVEEVNAALAADPRLKGSQIRRFLVLHKELDPDDGELTRTRKVRRGFIAEKYAPLVEALYSSQPSVHVETQVRFEDGRTGMVQADLPILEANVVEDETARRAA